MEYVDARPPKIVKEKSSKRRYIPGAIAGFSTITLQAIPSPIKFNTKPQFVSGIIHASVFFAVYENVKKKLREVLSGTSLINTGEVGIVTNSVLAGQLSALSLHVPIQNILTVRASFGVGRQKKLGGFLKAYDQLTGKESMGFYGLFRNYAFTFFSVIPASVIFFPIYESSKFTWYNPDEVTVKPFHPLVGFGCGAIAGCVAGAITTPLVPTQEMLSHRTTWFGFNSEFMELWRSLIKKNQEGGILKVYFGAPLRALTCTIGGSVLIGTYEIFRYLLV